MQVIKKVAEMQNISFDLKSKGKVVALVPTMGYFHEGHVSLIKRAKELADIVITSLFVNPTQFGPHEDFERYPRDIERDSAIASSAGTDYLFVPDVKEMYPIGYHSSISIGDVTDKFEGIKRPGHFDGVATVVAKLFNATHPDIAVFGQKDYQQTLVIKRLNDDFRFGIKIVIAPTIRQSDGLAMSSRNIYLSSQERTEAVILYKCMDEASKAIEAGEKRRKVINGIMHSVLRTIPSIKIDYASSADADSLNEPEEFIAGQHIVLLLACYLGKTRLIDNTLITIPGPFSGKTGEFKEEYR